MDGLQVPRWLAQFFDDASVLPPSHAAVATAVADFRNHLRSPYADLIGCLDVPDVLVPDLLDVLEDDGAEDQFPVCLRVTGGAGAVAPALRWAARSPAVGLHRIEVGLRDEDDLARNARRFVAALESSEEDLSTAEVFVEVPVERTGPERGWLAALDEIAAAGFSLSFRVEEISTGADPGGLAARIDAALDREIGFRLLGSVDRLTTGDPGSPSSPNRTPGFGNVLIATHACLAGAPASDVAELLVDPSWENLLGSVGLSRDDSALERSRRWVRSVSSVDLLETWDDLVAANLLAAP